MTELTDEAVQALIKQLQNFAQGCRGSMWQSRDETIRLCDEAARALLDARAELDRLRADAHAEAALVVEKAADACVDLADQVSDAALTGLPEQARSRESMAAAFTKASHVIRALAPADGLAAVEALRAEARESAMQALASMGQAQEAYEAQLKAEAELAAAQQREAGLREALPPVRDALDRAECCGKGVSDGYGPPECCGNPDYGLDRAQKISRAALSNNGRGE